MESNEIEVKIDDKRLHKEVMDAMESIVSELKNDEDAVAFSNILNNFEQTKYATFEVCTDEFNDDDDDDDDSEDSMEFAVTISFHKYNFEVSITIQDFDWDGSAYFEYYISYVDGKHRMSGDYNKFDKMIEVIIARIETEEYEIKLSSK